MSPPWRRDKTPWCQVGAYSLAPHGRVASVLGLGSHICEGIARLPPLRLN